MPFVSDRWCVDIRWFHHRSSQIFPNFNELSVWITFAFLATARETFLNCFVSCEVFVLPREDLIHWVARSWTTKAYRWLSLDSLASLKTLWSAVIKSPNFSARSKAVPVLLLQGILVILVPKHTSQFRFFFFEVSINTVLPWIWYHFRRTFRIWVLVHVLLCSLNSLWTPPTIQEDLANGRPNLCCHPSSAFFRVTCTSLLEQVRHFVRELE